MRIFLLSFFTLMLFACNKNNVSELWKLSETKDTFNITPLKPNRVLNVGFLAIDGVYNSELMAPFDILQHSIFHTEPALNTFIVSPSLEPITTFEKIKIIPDYSFENTPKIDILIVPSAEHNMDTDLEDKTLIAFIKEKGEKADFIMSLCDGAFMLAQAGLLNGLECITFPSDTPKFRQTFPQLKVHENVSFVHDGKAITSAGGAKSYDAALYLAELLYGKKVAQGIAGGLVIDWELKEIMHIRKNG
ncbi:MAG: DJ-1/PfpI family protein [Bacteroidota bacterium]